jgi:Recombinase
MSDHGLTAMISNILRNENYTGHIVYKRASRRLGRKRVKNPLDHGVRSELIVDPIIDRDLFTQAREMIESRYVSVEEDEMLLLARTAEA